MRALICLCLASSLWAGPPALPGRDAAFLSRILADPEGGAKPWKAFRTVEASASAVVEVVGELNAEERRQAAFQEFLAWFQADLHRFFQKQGWPAARNPLPATLPVARFGGNPIPQNVTLARIP